MIPQASSLAPVARAARALCIALLAWLALTLPASADDTQSIGSIDFISGQRGAMPGPDAAWQAHPLPLRWTSSSGTRPGLWLRFGFEVASAPAEGWSLLLDRLPSGGAIFLNGKMVADLPTESAQRHVRWRRPHLVNLPSEYLREGRNEGLIFTSYSNGVHGLGSLRVGPTAELQPLYGREFFVSHTLRWISLLLTVLLALGFGTLWLRRRSETLFGLLALIAAFWALRSIDSSFEMLTPDARAWSRGAFYLGTAAFTALATITLWRQSGVVRGRAEFGMVVLAGMGPALYLLSGDSFDLTVGPLWQAIMLGALALGVLSLGRRALRESTLMLKIIVAAMLLAIAASTTMPNSARPRWIPLCRQRVIVASAVNAAVPR